MFDLQSPKKVVAASTAKLYLRKLNKLAEHGYATPDDLLLFPEDVIKVIDSLTTDRRQLCLFYSAIFYAIGTQDFTKHPESKAYYDAFRKCYYTETYKGTQ